MSKYFVADDRRLARVLTTKYTRSRLHSQAPSYFPASHSFRACAESLGTVFEKFHSYAQSFPETVALGTRCRRAGLVAAEFSDSRWIAAGKDQCETVQS